ncbi:hypothetical protein G7077_08910 [Sphingomonas piscis]|uniref:Uncharacterized protein n=1 Tax=Sphingomonas piscis TaxID=2714943 RepID=A0A6G7YQH3_9SPHN|nr:hypothetical protein [Sphingomonas piscis]QIK78998.1 hypothetical protein G7077_08910 [Sphingomonas piscis]
MTESKKQRDIRLGRVLIGLGYTIVAIGAVLTPVAYALDWLDTLPAIAIALVIIAVGVAVVLTGDRLSDDGIRADGPPPPQPLVGHPEEGR